MEQIPSERTVELIIERKSEIGIEFPLRSADDLSRIAEYFASIEVSLSNGLCSGKEIDRKLLEDAENANQELTPFNSDDFIDIEKLNKRLMT